jgi:hypothetical protein
LETRIRFQKKLFYVASFLIVVLSILAFQLFTGQHWFNEEIMEITGIVSTFFMGLAMALYVGLRMLKKKMIPKAFLTFGVSITKMLHIYHYPISVLSYAFLVAHLLFSWDISKITSFDYIMGYASTVLIILSFLPALLIKQNRKAMTKAHVLISFTATIPFILHLID